MAERIDLVLMWHMHQPDYRLADAGGADEFVLPWTYLHAIKDYTDMAAHLERHPAMRAVVNFVPVLLDQLEDYAAQCTRGVLRDPLLRSLGRQDLGAMSLEERRALTNACFRSNHKTMLEPYPHYRRLHELYVHAVAEGDSGLWYFSADYFADLVTWYHLAWCGESERRQRPVIAQLLSKGSGFDHADRRALLEQIGQIVAALIPRYRALAAAGRIELSATPYAHPLAPLLIDLGCARQAMPDAPLPLAKTYPGGRTRAAAQVESGRATHAARFGRPPVGMWPAEGAVSDAFVAMLGDAGCQWAATSESVLSNSLRLTADAFQSQRAQRLYRPYRVAHSGPALFFRDERLSDLIGFEYSRWHGSDAARHFVAELERIADEAPAGERPIVSVILDGENAWEYYPYNGFYFLDHLYEAICACPRIRPTTYAQILHERNPEPGQIESLVAGSWVYGTLSTWIGETEKNRAWDLLCAAKQSYDLVMAGERLDPAARTAATAQLARCESSDWFWWFGAHNPSHVVQIFDGLFRANLKQLYRLLGLTVPGALDEPISHGGGDPEHGGTMRRAG
ncbi:MAG: glycoside hydrolase [Rhodocyclaceae bacterium]|nr:MAG: glycoside hydrolase [Rhodocyclaceae bacterium]